ncbi:MAG TPA: hypothetical protein VE646_09405, partial [Actinomycetota bacterium]|nr:hypothetical protein [Actinomycetota bacterium]
VLAGATMIVGYLGFAPTKAPFLDWVFFERPEAASLNGLVAGLSILAAGTGILVAYGMYREYRERDPLLAMGPVYTLLERKYYLDDIYWKGVIQPIRDQASAFANWSNQTILDGAVNGAARLARGLSGLVNGFDRNVVDGAVNGVAETAGFFGGLLRLLQSGNVQRYAAFLFTGVVILAVIFTRI